MFVTSKGNHAASAVAFLFREVPTPMPGEKDQKSRFTAQKTEGGAYTMTLPRSRRVSAIQQDLEAPSITKA